MPKFKAVIFDLDGTLSDSVAMILKSSESTHAKMGLPWEQEAVSAFIGRPLMETAACFAAGREAEYIENFGEFNTIYMPKMIKPFPGVPTLLSRLQNAGVELGIVTSRHQWGADWSVEILGLEGCFGVVCGVEATEKHKPEAEPALYALGELGVAPSDAVFIGDAPVDIACGKAAGMATIGVGWGVAGENIRLAEPDYYAANVNDLLKILL